jgi:hypothetical protein
VVIYRTVSATAEAHAGRSSEAARGGVKDWLGSYSAERFHQKRNKTASVQRACKQQKRGVRTVCFGMLSAACHRTPN